MVKVIRQSFNILRFALVMTMYFFYVAIGCIIMFIIGLFIRDTKKRRFVANIMLILWIHLTKTVLSYNFPRNVFIRYDQRALEKRRNIVMSNHLTEFDWFFICCILEYIHRFQYLYIILKRSLRDIPLFGFAMDFFQFIFLNRRLSKDIQIIHKGIQNLKNNLDFTLLMFPEGTYINTESHKKSTEWSKKAKIKVNGKDFDPKEVMIPRTTGFDIIYDDIKEKLEGIIDITLLPNPYVKYPSEKYTYWNVIANGCKDVNFCVFVDYIPHKKDIDTEKFMMERFEKKERVLNKYKKIIQNKQIKSLHEFIEIARDIDPNEDISHLYGSLNLNSIWGALFCVVFICAVTYISGNIYIKMFKS